MVNVHALVSILTCVFYMNANYLRCKAILKVCMIRKYVIIIKCIHTRACTWAELDKFL